MDEKTRNRNLLLADLAVGAVLLMLIFAEILYVVSGNRTEKTEEPVVTAEDVQRVKDAKMSARGKQRLEMDGEDIVIGEK